MSYIFTKGATSQSIELYIIDSTDGTPETGVLWNTAGIDLKYRRKDAVVVSITEAALTSPALTDTWETGGFLEIGNGVYRLDLPDAALASVAGIDRVVVFGTVTGMVVLPVTIHLTDFDLSDSVRGGLTALPNAVADAAGGLPISDAGGLDLDTQLATTDQIGAAGAGLTNINLPNQTMDITGNITGNLSGTVGSVTGAVGSVAGNVDGNVTGSTGSVVGAVGSVTGNVGGNVTGTVGSVVGAVGSVTGAVGSVTGHTNQTGDNFAIVNGAAGLVAIDTVVDAIKVVTDNMAAAATTMIIGTVSWDNTNATTTVIYSDDITEATADHYNGRLFVPTSGALLGQYTNITDYALDTGEGKFTVTAMTEPPADNTTFVIL